MKLIRLFALALIGLALSSNQASAQREDQFAWGIGGGATIPSGLADDSHKTGFHADANLGIGMVDSPWGVRFEGLYSKLGSRTKVVNTPAGPRTLGQGDAKLFELTGNGVFNVYGSNTHLYAIGGLGGYWYNPDGSGTKSENDFMLQAGAGIWLGFANAYVEAKWQNLYRALPNPDTGVNGKKSMRLYPVTLGFIF
jgi:hypothetical protein